MNTFVRLKKSVLICLLFLPLLLSAQKTNSGTEFWMGFMNNLNTTGHTIRLYISASNNSKVYISIPRQNFRDSILVPKDSVRVYLVPTSIGEMLTITDTIESKGIHITSDFPVSISAMNLSAATTDASVVLPLVNIPFSATYVTGNPNPGSDLVLLVATSDSTRVSISPNVTLTNSIRPATGPYNLILNRGESYQIGSTFDLSGTVIRVNSKSKLVVFSGARCNSWPCGACDHQYEQVMPSMVLDTAYCIPPQFGHTSGYLLKFVPLDTSTNLKINGRTYNGVSRNSPLVINVRGDSGYYASSNKLFHCYQFLKGAGCNGYITSGWGDPAMLSVVSTKHFGQSVIFSTVNSTNLRDHFVSVVIRTTSKNNVYLDKAKIDSSEFKVFPYAKGYSYAALKINDGVHLLESSDGLLAYCAGVGFYESYLYLAGFTLPNFDLDFSDSVLRYDCKNKQIRFQFRARSSTTLKSYKWFFGDGQTGTGNPAQHTYDSFGYISVKLVGEDFSGKKDSVTRIIRVDWPDFDPIRNKIICGLDTVSFEEKNPFFANFKWQDSSSLSSFKAWNNARLWVSATDTSGYCKFTDTGIVAKIDIFSSLIVDTIDNCYKFNRFRFRDSISIFADDIDHRAWVFPWTTVWDSSDIITRFPMPGKYKVYFDVYTKAANCKARYPIDITVHPNPKSIPRYIGDQFCSNKAIQFYDSSQIVTGRIAKVQWDFDDNSSISSDSLKTSKTLIYDKVEGQVVRFYNHIAISDYNCRDTALNAVQVWPKPIVGFTLNTADTVKCLPQARWTYTSTTKVDVDTFSLKWDAGNGVKGTGNDLRNVRYNSPGKYTVKLLALSPYGCPDSLSRTIEVLAKPKAGFLIADTAQCLNAQAFSLTDTTAGNALIRSWTLDENKFAFGSIVDSLRYQDTGLKTIVLRVSSAVPGCSDSAVRYLMVLAPPLAGISVNSDTQCLNGNRFDFENTSRYSKPVSGTEWYNETGLIGNSFNLFGYRFPDTGTYRIRMLSTDAEGCIGSDTIRILVAPHPVSDFNVNDSLQCFNENRFVFKTGIAAGVLKDWRRNDTLFQSSASDSAVVSGLGSGQHTISLIKRSAVGCSDSSSSAIRVLNAPQALIGTDRDTQCFDTHAFTFRNLSVAAGDRIVSKTFAYNTLQYPEFDSLTDYRFASAGNKTIRLRILTEQGCADSSSITITVLDNPGAAIMGDTVCLNEDALIRGMQISGSNIMQWQWNLGDGNTAGTQTVQHSYVAAGNYNLTLNVTDAYQCIGNTTLNAGVTVNPLPDPAFTIEQSSFGINQLKLKCLPLLNTLWQYEWLLPDGRQVYSDTPSLYISEQLKGVFYLTVRNEFGCTDSSSRYISVYPNNFNVFLPNAITVNSDQLNDVFRIEGIGVVQDFEMHLYNRWGEEIYFSNDVAAGWDGTYQGKTVQEGVYTYLIRFNYFDGKAYAFRGTLTVLR